MNKFKCPLCGSEMVLDDKDTFRGERTVWTICPQCNTSCVEVTNLKTQKITRTYSDVEGNEISTETIY